MHVRRSSLLAAALLGIAAACLAISTSAAQAKSPVRSVATGASDFGQILVDGRGYALYAFTKDEGSRSSCYGACAKAWPPLVVGTRPVARPGAKAPLVGVSRRRDGKLQATYAGRPLYYYVGDDRPGVVRCQDVDEFGGTWLVVRGSGKLVR